MLILFDHGTPSGLARALQGNTVKEARAQGWDTLSNSELLKAAQTAVRQGKDSEAIASLDEALNAAAGIQRRRNGALQNATSTWYKTWFPRVAEANGRRYLNQVDDVKDHRPARTVDMSYLVYRELLYPLGDWADGTLAARNEYARAHQLPVRAGELNWKDTTMAAN